MKKFAFLLMIGAFFLSTAAYANWDGGSGSTLDAPEEAYGEDPNQGTWHAEANS